MSAKQQLAEMVATLPETTTLEEAFDRLYKAFKEKQRRMQEPRRRQAGSAKGMIQIGPDFDAPLADFADYQ